MDWMVRLEGDEIYLQELAKLLTGPEISIENDKKFYFLKSKFFKLLTEGEEVRQKAYEIMLPINAGIILQMGGQKPIQIGFPIKINPDGKKRVVLTFSRKIVYNNNLSNETITSDGKHIGNPEELIILLYNVSRYDDEVKKVCNYISQNFNSWQTLYKIFEIIEADGFPLVQKSGTYRKKADLFRRTANNPSSSGLSSRHAIDKAPPKTPMTLSEAQDFIKTLIREWLFTKKMREKMI